MGRIDKHKYLLISTNYKHETQPVIFWVLYAIKFNYLWPGYSAMVRHRHRRRHVSPDERHLSFADENLKARRCCVYFQLEHRLSFQLIDRRLFGVTLLSLM